MRGCGRVVFVSITYLVVIVLTVRLSCVVLHCVAYRIDRIEYIPDEYVMAFRCSLLLRGFSYLLHYKFSHAKSWEGVARQVLREVEGEEATKSAQATAL